MTLSVMVSLHDVTPDTLPAIERQLEVLDGRDPTRITLLVVAGAGWRGVALDRLRSLSRRGYRLAGHGWTHACTSRRTLWHRLHGTVLSRDEAEHLSRPKSELRRRVEACHGWFIEVGLPTPDLYVPPAWAVGALDLEDLRELPFPTWETLTGLLDVRTGRRVRMPLMGFQADTPLRRAFLRRWNFAQARLARAWRRPARIALHPEDLDLRMGEELEGLLGSELTLVAGARWPATPPRVEPRVGERSALPAPGQGEA